MTEDSEHSGLLRPAIVARHYRGIIVTLVLVNTALIVFLIVYIWAFASRAPDSPAGGQPVASGVVRADRLILWSKPGGLEQGAESRGVVERGSVVRIMRGRRLEQVLWLEVLTGENSGWLPERDIDYADSTVDPAQQP